MASSLITSKLYITFFISSLLLISTSTTYVSAHQFQVNWSKPAANEVEIYSEWAQNHRFHVGDTVLFKYENDSVLLVDHSNYGNCNLSNPLLKLDNVFQFDRYGFFYFVSGKPGHCESGQKVIIRVMVHPEVGIPNIAPSPQEGSGEAGGPGAAGDWGGAMTPNSTVRLPIASYFMTALGGVMVILYLFM
ncbi:hypothetical protein IFM89_038656 [Coptis chinensis]|uniref:Phytocyanin domain-containing protein n=1 Tax=Coptis chinensis TaxID=261450 RepID=A0A835M332_9MAGN|nr:hypothetical protein IFM89_038656 [Coptis chinensis]